MRLGTNAPRHTVVTMMLTLLPFIVRPVSVEAQSGQRASDPG
jgi:hypothetical protein